ncbi:MAG: hypothetical protein ACRDDL_00190 [Sarcina sp.]
MNRLQEMFKSYIEDVLITQSTAEGLDYALITISIPFILIGRIINNQKPKKVRVNNKKHR